MQAVEEKLHWKASRIKALSIRQWIGIAIFFAGGIVLSNELFVHLTANDPRMYAAIVGGGAAALATALGTLPVLLSQKFTQKTYDCFLGFGGGVMLAATAFSLIVPALAAIKSHADSSLMASLIVGGGILIGASLILLLDRIRCDDLTMHHEAYLRNTMLRRAWLFVGAVALHNLPEGLAIGVGYAGIDLDKANMLATGISIQDVPEGLVVALALRGVGYSRLTSAGLGALSGLIEPVAAIAGVGLVSVCAAILPWGLASAAGAMLLVICRDVIPESHRHGNGNIASCCFVVGFILMTALDTSFG